jgi:hypothetical protein
MAQITEEAKQESTPMMLGTLAMDGAAARAAQTLDACETAKDVYLWYFRNYLAAGHKRLGRQLAAKGKDLAP